MILKGYSIDLSKPVPSFKNAKRSWQGKVVTDPKVKARIREMEWMLRSCSSAFDAQIKDEEMLMECCQLLLIHWFDKAFCQTIHLNTLIELLRQACTPKPTE